ncbi:MAG: Asp23/Gls24 family envelope stress response protein [Clostridiales Family XIII bacterium]|jgi:uncharacterized alkaline shock family protein YloU|nr:Asp23/Gls24 family envelope stress response protein [Clostridiales Family XIII bacterium]
MKITSLVGKSGTGKSFQAIGLCTERGIDYIIDDGLFIGHGTVLAGRSAKRQATKVGAIKTALFTDEEHRSEVAAKIAEEGPEALLIVGTSDRMVAQIAERLGLPPPQERIDIESITTADERRIAGYRRHELGQHIIPAPTLEVKRAFSGYFLHPIRVLRDMQRGRGAATERSVVRPTFSYFGKFSISDKAIRDIVEVSARPIRAVESVDSVFVSKRPDGIVLDMQLICRAGDTLLGVARTFQNAAKQNVEDMTSMNVLAANVRITDLVWEDAG